MAANARAPSSVPSCVRSQSGEGAARLDALIALQATQQLLGRAAPHRVELSDARIVLQVANHRSGTEEIIPGDLPRRTERAEEPRSLLHEMAGDPEQRVGPRARTGQECVAADAIERAHVEPRRLAKLVRNRGETRLHGQDFHLHFPGL